MGQLILKRGRTIAPKKNQQFYSPARRRLETPGIRAQHSHTAKRDQVAKRGKSVTRVFLSLHQQGGLHASIPNLLELKTALRAWTKPAFNSAAWWKLGIE